MGDLRKLAERIGENVIEERWIPVEDESAYNERLDTIERILREELEGGERASGEARPTSAVQDHGLASPAPPAIPDALQALFQTITDNPELIIEGIDRDKLKAMLGEYESFNRRFEQILPWRGPRQPDPRLRRKELTMHQDITYNDAWADQGIHIIKPRTDGKPLSGTAAMGNTIAISRELPAICNELGANLVIWDTVTATTASVFRESVDSGKHTTGGAPTFSIVDSDGNLQHRLNTADRRDYGLAQKFARDWVRDAQVKDPNRNYHLIHVAHVAESRIPIGKDSKGEAIFQTKGFGPSVGGPAAVEAWGTDYPAVHRVFQDPKSNKRILQLQTIMDGQGHPYWCRTNTGGNTPDTVPVPDTMDKALELWSQILTWMAIFPDEPRKGGYLTETLLGAPMSGKTRWASTLLAHPGISGLIYVAADGNSEYLSSFWNELKGLA